MNPAPEAAATIIERARELGPRERSEYVRHACGSDETLLSHVLLGLELLAAAGVLTDRKREPVALICAGIALIHFAAVFAVEQIGVNVYWTFGLAAVIGAELAAAAFLALSHAVRGKLARSA